jgi:hypothetical protein
LTSLNTVKKISGAFGIHPNSVQRLHETFGNLLEAHTSNKIEEELEETSSCPANGGKSGAELTSPLFSLTVLPDNLKPDRLLGRAL